MTDPAACADCGRSLDLSLSPGPVQCACGTTYPAVLLFTPPSPARQHPDLSGSAACFFDPDKPAEQICSECGRMMNSLYDFPLGDAHYCPDCLDRLRANKDPRLITFKTRWDHIAFYLSLLGIPFFWLTFFTAPAALAITGFQWKKPQSLVYKQRGYFITAALFAVLQCAGWLAFFGFLFYQIFQGSSDG